MKKATCSVLVGATITALVIFLLGVDIAAKRRHKVSSLLHNDNNKSKIKSDKKVSDKNPQISDIQILSLVDKRIQKLEDTLNDFMHKTNERSKTRRDEIPKKFINIGDSQKTIEDKLSSDSTKEGLNMKPAVKFVPNQPVVGKYVFDKKEPLTSETSNNFGNYNPSKTDPIDEKTRNSPGYLKSLLGKFHIDLIKWAIKDEQSKDTVDKNQTKNLDTKTKTNNDSFDMSKDKNNFINMTKDIFKRDVVDLSPKSPFELSKQPIFKPEITSEKVQSFVPPKIEKPKSPGFLTRAVDEALIPSDNIPNLTDFSTKDASYHPIFFAEKSKDFSQKPSSNVTPSADATPSSDVTPSANVTPSPDAPKIILPPLADTKTKLPAVETKKPLTSESDEGLKKPQLTSEDQKAITDEIENIFADTSVKKETAPLKTQSKFKTDVLPLKKESDFIKKDLSPLEKKSGSDLIKKDVSPLKKESDFIKKDIMPLKKEIELIKNVTAPVKKENEIRFEDTGKANKIFPLKNKPTEPLTDLSNGFSLFSDIASKSLEDTFPLEKFPKPIDLKLDDSSKPNDDPFKKLPIGTKKSTTPSLKSTGFDFTTEDKKTSTEKPAIKAKKVAISTKQKSIKQKASKTSQKKKSSSHKLGNEETPKLVKISSPKVPVKNIIPDNFQTEKITLPTDNLSFPSDASSLPVKSSSLPVKSSPLPVESSPLPVESSSLTSETNSSLSDSSSLPSETSTTDPLNLTPESSSDPKPLADQIDKIFDQEYVLPEETPIKKTKPANLQSLEFKIIKGMVDDLRSETLSTKEGEEVLDESIKKDEESKLEDQATSPVEI